jgi:FlaA1/EpsC-like NDP-sugar epimerase
LIDRFHAKEVYLAISSLTARERKTLITRLMDFPVKVSVLPGLDEIVSGKVSFSDVREVDIEDLLGRDSVAPQQDLLSDCITDKSVMVTGAGGSIGSELCRQIIKENPSQLVLFEICEFALYQIERELHQSGIEVISVLGSVQDAVRLKTVINRFKVETIYHAAAYKHVPLVEHNIEQGIRNNSFGSFTLARVAAELEVQNFVLISTDKAVRPTNVMGASKRLAEMSLQALQAANPKTRFVMVRFGNVLGSSGSVIPVFRKQINEGGPVTVTHPEITRFFMTIPEAASLVIQAGSMGTGGDVFVLDMGEPIKIVDLAKKIIKLSGFEVAETAAQNGIEIKFTGLRPGEKLYEELLIGNDVDGTDHPRIMKAHEEFINLTDLNTVFKKLDKAMGQQNYEKVLELLTHHVNGFHHTSGVVDWLKQEHA